MRWCTSNAPTTAALARQTATTSVRRDGSLTTRRVPSRSMLVRLDGRVLAVHSCDGSVQREVDFGGLHAVSSVRVDPSARWLAVTAVVDGGATPDVRQNQRG